MLKGAGLGYRREMSDEIQDVLASDIDFLEIAPENWMRLGGQFEKQLLTLSERKPISTHGLSLSIGSPDPLDVDFVQELKRFFQKFNISHYTEHLSYCSMNGHMYDLMPIPFTSEAVQHVSERIRRVQDILEQQIAIENVSYYLAPGQELSEVEFTSAVLAEADCKLLLDVNNVFVNSINHKYDAREFIKNMPTERILYGHIAGHYDEAEDLKVDTHGCDVKEDVWELLRFAFECHGTFPTLLERDFNVPPFKQLLDEVNQIKNIQYQVTRGD